MREVGGGRKEKSEEKSEEKSKESSKEKQDWQSWAM